MSSAFVLCAYRFALRVKPAQQRQLRRWAGQLRWLWNQALAQQQARRARGEKYAGYADMCKWLTAWRTDPATSWLAEGPVHPQQQVLRRLDEAYRRFFAKQGGFPAFKRYGDDPGIRFPDPKQFALDNATGRINLPKLGWLRLRLSQQVDGAVRNASITREGSAKHARWFASLQVEHNETIEALDVAPTLGIDLGLTVFAATSEAEMVAPLAALAAGQKRLRRYQRSVSRKKKGSANRRKTVSRLGALHRRIAHQRADWLHKLTTDLADRHAVVALEDLAVKNMSASARGTASQPGRCVKQKAGLNRGILDAAWGEFARQLTYKVQWRGGRVILVDAAYTSRTCRICTHESAENRKSQALFACVACGHTENADVHAARNILARGIEIFEAQASNTTLAAGHAVSACGGAVRRQRGASRVGAAPAKQEPTEAKALA